MKIDDELRFLYFQVLEKKRIVYRQYSSFAEEELARIVLELAAEEEWAGRTSLRQIARVTLWPQ